MLRYGFLPSDFHPLMLFLGEAEDLSAFAALLRDFCREQRDVAFETVPFMQAAASTPVRLTTAGVEPGMRPVPGTARSFTWMLAPLQAEVFAEMLTDLVRPECRSGSVILETTPSEIPVKVSFGEYTDDFLTNRQVAIRHTAAACGQAG
jgi:hypothetical protein